MLAEKRLRRGEFTSVKDLEAALEDFIEQHNKNPKPFVWMKSTEEIVEKVSRARETRNLLGAVVHGFDDETCIKALQNLAAASADAGARIALMELVMAEAPARCRMKWRRLMPWGTCCIIWVFSEKIVYL